MSNPVQPEQPQFEVFTPEAPAQPETVVQPVTAPQRKKTGVVVLTIVAVLLLGAAGAFGALYFVEKGHSADLSKQVEAKDQEIVGLTKKAADADKLATTASDERRKAENEKNALQACQKAARAVTEAGISQDEQKIAAAFFDVVAKC